MNHTYTDWQQKTYKIIVGGINAMTTHTSLIWQNIKSTYASTFDQHTDQ